MPPGRIIAANLALAHRRRPPRRDVHDGETPALPVDVDARVRSSSLSLPAFRSAAARKAGAAAAERERAWPRPPAPGLRSRRALPCESCVCRRRRKRGLARRFCLGSGIAPAQATAAAVSVGRRQGFARRLISSLRSQVSRAKSCRLAPSYSGRLTAASLTRAPPPGPT